MYQRQVQADRETFGIRCALHNTDSVTGVSIVVLCSSFPCPIGSAAWGSFMVPQHASNKQRVAVGVLQNASRNFPGELQMLPPSSQFSSTQVRLPPEDSGTRITISTPIFPREVSDAAYRAGWTIWFC